MRTMLRQKLLKAPARILLLTCVMSAGVMVSSRASTPRLCTLSAPAGGQGAVAKSPRARPETDFARIEGIHRWGLNE
ncbi:MAG TPA: hypothetical protein VNN22_11735 [Verrucomicrobiae bacterium]|nr:hypothetical protein [Verrucomicrobiae bacterium]